MNVTNVFRATLLPLTFLFLLIGTILWLVGAASFFKLDPKQVQRDGLTNQLDIFTDCDAKIAEEAPAVRQRITQNQTTSSYEYSPSGSSEIGLLQQGGAGAGGGSGPGGQQTGQGGGQSDNKQTGGVEDVTGLLQNRCEIAQRPYKWLLLWTGAAIGLTFLLLAWLYYRASSGILAWLGVHTAVTIALIVVAIYAAMQLLTPTRDLADCSGFSPASIAEIQRQGFICYNNPARPAAIRLIEHWATIFWVGAGFSLVGMGMLSLLLPLFHWAKTVYGDPNEPGGHLSTDPRSDPRTGRYDTRSTQYSHSGYPTYDNRRTTYDDRHQPGFFDRMFNRDQYETHHPGAYDNRGGVVDHRDRSSIDMRGIDHSRTGTGVSGVGTSSSSGMSGVGVGGDRSVTSEHRPAGPIDRMMGRGDQQTTTTYDRPSGSVTRDIRDTR